MASSRPAVSPHRKAGPSGRDAHVSSISNGADGSDTVRLGISPLSWVNEVLTDLGRSTTAEQCLSGARAAGYDGVELSRIFPSDADALTALLRAHDLSLASGWYSGFLAERDLTAELDAVRAHAGLLRACGATVMVYGECGRMAHDALDGPMASSRLIMPPDAVAEYGARLTAFAEALHKEFGLTLAYHHHLMMVAETLEEVRGILSATGPAVGLLLDTGHAAAAGFDYADLIDDYGPRIAHIHLKDVRHDILDRIRSEGHSFNDGVRAGMFTVPGDGDVDFAPMAAFLATGAYRGWIVVEAEQDPAKAPPAETVARARSFVMDRILEAPDE